MREAGVGDGNGRTGEADLDAFAEIAVGARGHLFGDRPGRHRSRTLGAGGPFAGLAPLMADPDPRRIDLRAALRDPFGALWVRRHHRTVATDVVALVDCSASMGYVGAVPRADVVRLLVGGLAHAVSRSSDRFGLLLAGETVAPARMMPPSPRRDLAVEVGDLVAAAGTAGRGAAGLLAAADLLPRRRCVVLLVSDFTFGDDQLDLLLDRLAGHDVRPLVLRDSAAEDPDPSFGLVDLVDLEDRSRSLVLMRPALAARWRAAAAVRRRRLAGIFAAHDLAPVEILDRIDPEALFEALASGGAT